ncbi:MAG: isoprenylcysteine carboxylmethyltransferase family protein [candidate division WOR-3 bacterium]|nr:MAG: isoprenylcysteine carboxylmethyltransferase family protein [candidate division WOR-3 bacterium]
MGHHRGRERKDLVGEHPFGDTGQLILLLVFLIVWIGDSFILKLSTMATQYVPVSVRVVLFLVGITLAGILAQRGLSIVFGEERERPCVIKKGVFNLVRHPIYLGSLLLYLSCLLLTLSLLSVLVWLIIIAFYVYISRHEEKLLLARFGSEYEDYMGEVPMLIPWTKRRKT